MMPGPRVAFLWPGLPDYGARLIRAFVERDVATVDVVATRPSVPIQGMEHSLGQHVQWIEDDAEVTWQELNLQVPDVLFQGGWGQRSVRSLATEARHHNAKIILMNDQNWQGGLRQRLFDPILFRAKRLKVFDAAFVPGKSGAHYARTLGFTDEKIATGLYGADPSVFHGGAALHKRPKEFLFIGQLIARKNILNLVQAFLKMAADFPDWSLRICGSGELASQIPAHAQIHVQGFVQPVMLANLLRQSRCLVLPSLEEHWGLVVHEAASCGCALALSDTVGSADDFSPEGFPPYGTPSIEIMLRRIALWSDAEWQSAENSSRKAALNFGPHIFADAAERLIKAVLR